MHHRSQAARINVKLLVILILVTTAVGISLVAARQIRRSILSKMSLETGEAAFAKGDWPAAYKNLQEYLGRNPDDVEILKKYAKARMAIRPLEQANIAGAISAYRRVLQLVPLDEVAYDQLAILYPFLGDFESFAYIARMRIERTPKDPNDRKAANDWKAPLWLADALVRLNKKEEALKTLTDLIGGLELPPDQRVRPDRHAEYVQACVQMSGLTAGGDGAGAEDAKKAGAGDQKTARPLTSLQWLSRAVDHAPESAEARAYRAQLYREASAGRDANETRKADFSRRAQEDLDAADRLAKDNPGIRYSLGQQWLALGELDRAGAELQAIEKLPQEAIEKSFFDMDGWKVARFLLASELALRRNATTEALSLADDTLAALAEKRHRIKVLPSAISVYLTAREGAKIDTEAVGKARKCLDEYLDLVRGQQAPAASPLTLAWLEAWVERAEDRPYAVIDTLRPVAVSTSASLDMWRIWRLLSEAYSRTNQPARAIGVELQYLQFFPRDPQMLRDLARQYSLMEDWRKAFETAQRAESAGATDSTTKLLRIQAGVNLAAGPEGKADAAKLKDLSTELDSLRQEQPKNVDIRLLQASAAYALGQTQEVEKQLKRAIEECNEPLRAEMVLARYYRDAKHIPEAVNVCEAACKRHPGVAEPWLLLAGIHQANANHQAARQTLEQGLASVSNDREQRLLSRELARLECLQGDRAAGVHLLEKLAEQDAQDIPTRVLLLRTCVNEIQRCQTAAAQQTGGQAATEKLAAEYAAAEKLIAELKEAEGTSGLQWRLYQASLWLLSNDWRSKQQEIANLLQYCIEADPQGSTPQTLLVEMYDRLGDFRRMEDLCRQALLQNPAAAGFADKLLALLQRQGRSSEAEKVLQQIRMDPRRVSAWQVNLALGARDFTKAIDELTLQTSKDDQDAGARVALARLIYRQRKDAGQALQYLNEAETTPDPLVLDAALRTKAAILKSEGRADEARRVLDDYVAKFNTFDAYRARADYLAAQDESQSAEQDYRKLTTFADRSGTGYLLLADFYAGRNGVDKAAATLEEGLKTHPEDSSLERGLMRLLLSRAPGQGRARGMEILASLEKRLPQDPELMWLRAGLLLESPTPDSIRQARTILENVVKLAPTAVDAHLALIGSALQTREYRAARDYALRALVSNSNNRGLRLAQARAELELQNYPTASELAHGVLQEDPNSMEAIDVLLDTGRRSRNDSLLKEAQTWVDAAVRRDPANERFLFTRACVLAASQPPEVDELKTVISTCLSAKTQDVAMLLRTASVVASSSSTELKKEGVRLFERAADLSPASSEARLGLASVLYQTGETDRAEKIYREVLEQHPDSIQALNDLAWILQEHGQRYDKALELADKALTLAPDNLNLLDTRGTILAQLPERLTDARSDFAKLVEVSPPDSPRKARALLQLGRVCFKLKDLSQAKQSVEKALQIDQKVPILTEAERAEIFEIRQKSGVQDAASPG